MINGILVPLDGSELAESALAPAKDLAKALNAKLYLVRVFEVPFPPEVVRYGEDPEGAIEVLQQAENEDRKKAEAYLSRLSGRLSEEGLDVSWDVVEGMPAGKIVEIAHSDRADLVAMSTHGRTGPGRTVFGSVADQVLREVGTPVLLVRPEPRTEEKQA